MSYVWYFRNALVRANYTNLKKGVHVTTEYLELFLRNLLLAENIKKSVRTVKTITSLHEKKGLIIRVNGKRFGYWKVNVE